MLLDPAETGAVTIALHQDVQGEAFDYPVALLRAPRLAGRAPRPRRATSCRPPRTLLRAARRPLSSPAAACATPRPRRRSRRFAEAPGIPVAETSAGKGVAGGRRRLARRHRRQRHAARRTSSRATPTSSLCVGTRLTDFTTGSHSLFQHPDVRFVGDQRQRGGRGQARRRAVVADAREALDALRDALGGRPSPPGYRADVARRAAWRADARGDLAPRAASAMGQGEVLRAHQRARRARATGWSPPPAGSRATCSSCGRRRPAASRHIEFAFSCMGHEIPAGLGIRLHEGDGRRGHRRHRRRHLPDEPDRARDRGPGGPQAHRGAPRQRRLSVDQPAGAGHRGAGAATSSAAAAPAGASPTASASRSTTSPTRAAFGLCCDARRDAGRSRRRPATARGRRDHHRHRLPDRAGRACSQPGLLGPRGPEVAADEADAPTHAEHLDARGAQRPSDAATRDRPRHLGRGLRRRARQPAVVARPRRHRGVGRRRARARPGRLPARGPRRGCAPSCASAG